MLWMLTRRDRRSPPPCLYIVKQPAPGSKASSRLHAAPSPDATGPGPRPTALKVKNETSCAGPKAPPSKKCAAWGRNSCSISWKNALCRSTAAGRSSQVPGAQGHALLISHTTFWSIDHSPLGRRPGAPAGMAKPRRQQQPKRQPGKKQGGSKLVQNDVYEAEDVEAPEDKHASRFDVRWEAAGRWTACCTCSLRACIGQGGPAASQPAAPGACCRPPGRCGALPCRRAHRRARPPPRHVGCSTWKTTSTSCLATLRTRRSMRTWPLRVRGGEPPAGRGPALGPRRPAAADPTCACVPSQEAARQRGTTVAAP